LSPGYGFICFFPELLLFGPLFDEGECFNEVPLFTRRGLSLWPGSLQIRFVVHSVKEFFGWVRGVF